MFRRRYMKLRTYFHLVQRLRMGGTTPLTYHTFSWRASDLYKEGPFSTIMFPIPSFYFSNLTMQLCFFPCQLSSVQMYLSPVQIYLSSVQMYLSSVQITFSQYRCTFPQYSCTSLQYRCTFCQYRCTSPQYRCTFPQYRCTLLVTSFGVL